MCYFTVLMSSLLFYNVEKKEKKTGMSRCVQTFDWYSSSISLPGWNVARGHVFIRPDVFQYYHNGDIPGANNTQRTTNRRTALSDRPVFL